MRPLSTRHIECLRLAADGLTNRQIGKALELAETTVKDHLIVVRRRLRATNTAHAVALGYQTGLLAVGDAQFDAGVALVRIGEALGLQVRIADAGGTP